VGSEMCIRDRYKSLDYMKMTPVLVEAMKEQQAIIEQLKSELAKSNAEMRDYKASINSKIEKLEKAIENKTNSELKAQY